MRFKFLHNLKFIQAILFLVQIWNSLKFSYCHRLQTFKSCHKLSLKKSTQFQNVCGLFFAALKLAQFLGVYLISIRFIERPRLVYVVCFSVSTLCSCCNFHGYICSSWLAGRHKLDILAFRESWWTKLFRRFNQVHLHFSFLCFFVCSFYARWPTGWPVSRLR